MGFLTPTVAFPHLCYTQGPCLSGPRCSHWQSEGRATNRVLAQCCLDSTSGLGYTREPLSKLLAISAAFDANQELAIMTAGKTPPPSAVSDDLFDALQKLHPASKEE